MEQQKKPIHKKIIDTVYFKLGVTFFVVYLLIYYWKKIEKVILLLGNAITPILVGLIMAYVVNILLSFVERNYDRVLSGSIAVKCKRCVCIIISFLFLILIIAGVIGIVVPQLSSCISLLVSRSDVAANHLADLFSSVPSLEKYGKMLEESIANLNPSTELVQKVVALLRHGNTGWISNFTSVLQKVTGFATSMVIGLFFSFYLLYDKEKLQRQSKRVIQTYCPGMSEKAFEILRVFNDSFRSFIVGQVKDACVLGLMCAVTMFVFSMPYAGMISAIIAVTALIPIVGAIIGALVGFILILSVSTTKAFLFVLLFIVVQQIDNNVTYPRIVGGSIGLPGIWVLAAVTIGGSAFGVLGMLFLIPLFSGIYKLVRMDMKRRNAKQKLISK